MDVLTFINLSKGLRNNKIVVQGKSGRREQERTTASKCHHTCIQPKESEEIETHILQHALNGYLDGIR